MLITIANYEEFFLLYVDGELSVAGMEAVKQFVKDNPQYAEELEILQQMKLPAEEMMFGGKDLLLRNGEEGVSVDNYENWFLLYVDRELSAEEMISVETFVLKHPALQEQFMQLKQARLEPEPIVCPDKESLYRKEEKKRPIIWLNWQRIEVAAALVGVVVLTWMVMPADRNNLRNTLAQNPVASGNSKVAPGNKESIDPASTDRPVQAEEKIRVTDSRSSITKEINEIAAIKKKSQAVTDEPVQQPADNTIPDRTTTARLNAEPVTTVGAEPVLHTPAKVTTDHINDRQVSAANNDDNLKTIAQPAVYKELDTDEDNKSLYVGSLEINKDKLRGFFRKAGSLFRGKAKQQEEEKAESTASNTRSLK